MAIRRIYPIKDSFIFSSSLEVNCGLDEILEVGNCIDTGHEVLSSARILMQFNPEELTAVLNTLSTVSGSKASLGLFLAGAENLPDSYSFVCQNIGQSWVEGTGKANDPAFNRGASWKYRDLSDPSSSWTIAGGNLNLSQSYVSSSVFYKNTGKDISLDVTNYISTSSQEGFVLALNNESKALSENTRLGFYSTDTHTVYRPYLEYRWDDSVYSSSLEPVSSSLVKTSATNLANTYHSGDKIRLQIGVSPMYPERVFTTSSIYQNNKILPQTTYWGIKDEYAGTMVVDFDSNYTKVSANNTGNFIDIDTSILEPERYYRLLLQVNINGSSTIIDNRSIFRVVRDGKRR